MLNKLNESDCLCPRCGKSWQGMTLQSIFFMTNKKAYPNKTNAEINAFVKKQLKENGKTGQEHVTALIPAGGVWRCPDCGLLVAESDVWRLVDNKHNRKKLWFIGWSVRIKAKLRLKHNLDAWIIRRYTILQNKPKALLKGVRLWMLFTPYYLTHRKEFFNGKKQ